jgi:hypothetical protein
MKINYMKCAIQEMRTCFSAIDCALLTTYTFNPSFFENNLLPILFDHEPEGRHILRPILNKQLKDVPVAVFYDESTRPQLKNGYRYAQTPVYLKESCFHAKIIIIAGKSANDGKDIAVISVSSGNITMAGWSGNREVVSWMYLNGNNAQTAVLFVEWLEQYYKNRYKGIIDHQWEKDQNNVSIAAILSLLSGKLKACAEEAAAPLEPELWINWPGKKMPGFLVPPSGKKWDSLTVASPYWTSDAGVFAKFQSLCLNLRLLPSKNLKSNKYEVAQLGGEENNLLWFKEKASDNAGNCFSHAKVYIAKKEEASLLCIGSANATIPGLGMSADFGKGNLENNNIEAMLIYNFAKDADLGTCELIDPSLIDKNQKAGENEPIEKLPFQVDIASRIEETAQIVVYRIIQTGSKNVVLKQLVVGNIKKELNENTLAGRFHISPSYKAINSFLIHYEKEGIPHIYCGPLLVFGGTDAQLGYRQRSTLSSIFALMMKADVVKKGKERKKIITDPEIPEELVEDVTPEPDYDYFQLFRSFFRYRKRLLEKPERAGENSTVSIESLVEHARDLGLVHLQPFLFRYCMMVQIAEVSELEGVRAVIGERAYFGIQDELKELNKMVLTKLGETPQSLSSFPKPRRFMRWFRSEMTQAWEREYE